MIDTFRELFKQKLFLAILAAVLLHSLIVKKAFSCDSKAHTNYFPNPEKEAYVTALTGDSYKPAIAALSASLRSTHTRRKLVCLVSPSVTSPEELTGGAPGLWDEIRVVQPISNPQADKFKDHRFLDTYTKLRVWEAMADHSKIVFLDADTVVLRNIDELFLEPEMSATPDCCDKLNSGVMVIEPSEDTFRDMMTKIDSYPSYDGGDQGFLNVYFPAWRALKFAYNADQQILAANRHAWTWDTISIVHYVAIKPWKEGSLEGREDLRDIHAKWHHFYEMVATNEKQ